MKLDDARKVVGRAPKTELGLAARLILWELERREELADPQPKLDSLHQLLDAERQESKRLATHAAWLADKVTRLKGSLARAEENRNAWKDLCDRLDKATLKAQTEHRDELDRLRRLEQAVKDIRRGTTVADRARRVQDRIVAYLEPHLLPDK